MKFDLSSDLHLHTPYDLNSNFYKPNSSILALLGDVCEFDRFKKMIPFYEKICNTWEHVLFVPGNHEFYLGRIDSVVNHMKNSLKHLENFHILDNDIFQIENTLYIGSTLWSDMRMRDPMVMLNARKNISDYLYIAPSRKIIPPKTINILPEDTVKLFEKNVKFIEEKIFTSNTENVVVLTHHAPSYQSVHPKFKLDPLNGAFVSDLEYMIVKYPKLKVWAHGHTHCSMYYHIEECLVVCSPLGYHRELYSDISQYRSLLVDVK